MPHIPKRLAITSHDSFYSAAANCLSAISKKKRPQSNRNTHLSSQGVDGMQEEGVRECIGVE
ncbi:hypothetical protein E2C01_014652 [Portunus trituberculatus]|uniref:Uncharacterized protein n=1 Tax=Portunus trituberculatus TaxID=210409 RepID=A0A5B7DJE9_PORTR|nr:hypothetical protein [Portunus trituberculatus]